MNVFKDFENQNFRKMFLILNSYMSRPQFNVLQQQHRQFCINKKHRWRFYQTK